MSLRGIFYGRAGWRVPPVFLIGFVRARVPVLVMRVVWFQFVTGCNGGMRNAANPISGQLVCLLTARGWDPRLDAWLVWVLVRFSKTVGAEPLARIVP